MPNPEFTSFARLVESLSPWLDQVVSLEAGRTVCIAFIRRRKLWTMPR
jgi:hypothetical protein